MTGFTESPARASDNRPWLVHRFPLRERPFPGGRWKPGGQALRHACWSSIAMRSIASGCGCTWALCARMRPWAPIDLTEFEPWSTMVTGRECDVLLLAASFGTSPEDPEAQGLDLLRKLRARNVASAVIALAEDGNELTAVRALQLGAVGLPAEAPAHAGAPEDLRARGAAPHRAARRPPPRRPGAYGSARCPRCAPRSNREADASTPLRRLAPETTLTRRRRSPATRSHKKIGESEKAVVYLAASAALGRRCRVESQQEPHARATRSARRSSANTRPFSPSTIRRWSGSTTTASRTGSSTSPWNTSRAATSRRACTSA